MENRTQTFLFLSLLLCAIFLTVFLAFTWLLHYINKLLSQIDQLRGSQKLLLKEINRIAESEKETIAKNLHDDIGSQLSIVKLLLTKVLRNSDNVTLFQLLISESMGLLDQSIDSIRSVSKELSSPTLLKLGYAKAIAELCRLINSTDKLKIELYDNYRTRLNAETELQVYRIVQETLNNVAKHSGASQVRIYIDSDATGANTLIIHDGKGLTEKMIPALLQADSGSGLRNIRHRAGQINAAVNYLENNNEFIIKIEIPFYEKKNKGRHRGRPAPVPERIDLPY